MNPWGLVLVALGIVLIIIGFTGSQHKILSVVKGIPSAATTASTTSNSSGSNLPPLAQPGTGGLA